MIANSSHGKCCTCSNYPSDAAVRDFPFPRPDLLSGLYPCSSNKIEVVGRVSYTEVPSSGVLTCNVSACGWQATASCAEYYEFDFPGVMLRTTFEGTQAYAVLDGATNFFNVFVDDALV